MATQHPTPQELAAIRQYAKAGDESAAKYIKLLEACTIVLEASNGIAIARGLMGPREDVYMHAIDDALSDLVPVIVEVAAQGMESIAWYLPSVNDGTDETDLSQEE